MNEMRITQTKGFVWMKWAWLAIFLFFFNYFFFGNKNSLIRYTRSNRQHYQLTVNLDLLHTLSILPFPFACPVSSLLNHSLVISILVPANACWKPSSAV